MNMSKIKSKKKLAVILIIISALAIFGFIQFRRANQQNILETQINQVEYTVEKGSIKKSITGSGSVKSSDSRTILSEMEGIIEEIYVEEGQEVNKDEILALYEIESDTSEELNLETQKFNLLKSQNNLKELYEKQNDLETYSEFSGVVTLLVEEGDEVSQNMKIGELKETGVINFQSYFTKNQIETMDIGDEADVFINSSLVTLKGEITQIDKTPVPTGSNSIGYLVEGKINYDGTLEKGSDIKVSVSTDSAYFTSPYTGEILANSIIELKSPYMGEVKNINVKNGEKVDEGQLILNIKSDELEMEIAQQQLNVEKNRLELENLTEENSTVTSPIKGTILTVSTDEQGYIEKGKQLFQIANLENMEVVISVDELDILNVLKGQEVYIESDVFEGENFKGKVKSISLEGSNQSGVTTYDVTVSLEDRKQLMSGMNVDVEILIEEKEDTLIIPIESVTKVGSKYVVSTKDSEGNLKSTPIEVGITTDNNIEVISGLKEGDTIYYNTEAGAEFPGGVMMPGMGLGGGQGQGRNPDGGSKE
jgi:HlyD family secretion protein